MYVWRDECSGGSAGMVYDAADVCCSSAWSVLKERVRYT